MAVSKNSLWVCFWMDFSSWTYISHQRQRELKDFAKLKFILYSYQRLEEDSPSSYIQKMHFIVSRGLREINTSVIQTLLLFTHSGCCYFLLDQSNAESKRAGGEKNWSQEAKLFNRLVEIVKNDDSFWLRWRRQFGAPTFIPHKFVFVKSSLIFVGFS